MHQIGTRPVFHTTKTGQFGERAMGRSSACIQRIGWWPNYVMPAGTEDYVDLAKTILMVKAKMTKPNGTNLTADKLFGMVNNFLRSLLKQVDVFLKEKQVTQSLRTYAHRAYLETLLNYGPSAKESQLTSALFYKDTAGKMDGFCIMASADGANHKVKLTGACLKIRKVKVSPSISVAHEITLKKAPASYPIHRVACTSFIIPAGNPSLTKDNVFNGLILKSFIFGSVTSDAFTGVYKKNQYNFQHFNVSSITLSINGEPLPFQPMQLSFGANPQYIEAFNTLFSGTGKMYYNCGNDILREEFPNGYAIYAFDLTPDVCGSSPHFNAVQRGNLAVTITFSVAPTAAVSLVRYGEFENLITPDEHGANSMCTRTRSYNKQEILWCVSFVSQNMASRNRFKNILLNNYIYIYINTFSKTMPTFWGLFLFIFIHNTLNIFRWCW